ncbi:hypothetical protein ACI3SI_19625, partial [Lactococcus lactis]
DKEQARLTLDDTSISVFTDQPSIVIFTANFGDLGTLYHEKKQVHHGGITFECQVSPGSEQIPELGDITILGWSVKTEIEVSSSVKRACSLS